MSDIFSPDLNSRRIGSGDACELQAPRCSSFSRRHLFKLGVLATLSACTQSSSDKDTKEKEPPSSKKKAKNTDIQSEKIDRIANEFAERVQQIYRSQNASGQGASYAAIANQIVEIVEGIYKKVGRENVKDAKTPPAGMTASDRKLDRYLAPLKEFFFAHGYLIDMDTVPSGSSRYFSGQLLHLNPERGTCDLGQFKSLKFPYSGPDEGVMRIVDHVPCRAYGSSRGNRINGKESGRAGFASLGLSEKFIVLIPRHIELGTAAAKGLFTSADFRKTVKNNEEAHLFLHYLLGDLEPAQTVHLKNPTTSGPATLPVEIGMLDQAFSDYGSYLVASAGLLGKRIHERYTKQYSSSYERSSYFTRKAIKGWLRKNTQRGKQAGFIATINTAEGPRLDFRSEELGPALKRDPVMAEEIRGAIKKEYELHLVPFINELYERRNELKKVSR